MVVPIVKRQRLAGAAPAQTSLTSRHESFGRAREGHERALAPVYLACFVVPFAQPVVQAGRRASANFTLGVMKSLSITSDASLLVVTIDDDGSGDLLVSIEASSDGFSGHADGHVVGEDWERFATELEHLEKNRKGVACFSSAFPGEFEVVIEARDSVGHMGVSGSLQYRRVGAEQWPAQQLHFAFEFDPSLLNPLVEQLSK